MFTATRIAAAVAIIALAGSLALVNGNLGPAPGPGAAPAAESPSPSPSTVPAVRVEGVSQIAFESMGVTDASGPVELLRGMKLRIQDEMSDPRASGVGHVIIDAEDYGGMGPEWGTLRLENDEGAWEGPVRGVHMGVDTRMSGWLQGEGAYTGLSYYYGLEIDNSGLTAVVEGITYPGGPPPTE